MRTYTQEDVIAMVKKRQASNSLRYMAAKIGISPAYLSDVYRFNRLPGRKILAFLGLRCERVTTYTYMEK